MFVTGNQKLLNIGYIEGLVILSTRRFWEKHTAPLQRGAGHGTSHRSRYAHSAKAYAAPSMRRSTARFLSDDFAAAIN